MSSPELTLGGAVLPPTSRSFRLALLGVGFLLFAAGHADADSVYEFPGEALSTPVTVTAGFAFAIQQETFRYDRDVECDYECGAAALLSWSMQDDGGALDSGDGLPLENGYTAAVLVNDEDYLLKWGIDPGIFKESSAGAQ